MLKVTTTITDHSEFNDEGEFVKKLDTPRVRTEESRCNTTELVNLINNVDVAAFVKSTPLCIVNDVAEWIGDTDGDLKLTHSELANDEIYVTTRSGGGKVLKLAGDSYSYNHSYQDYGLDEPCELAETIIKWEAI